ncbi:MAG: glycosyltransferase family 2 protein [Clostridiaceae bacterium]|jgi:glycosyltransferase involved in cell wall biosynthesis|nr:glycosyltransferase family 2 protein [Clostridiaceae bacterium]
MKLIIQIPCFNEEAALPITLKALPKSIDGIDDIEILIIDDGSTDNTVEIAKKLGIKNFVIQKQNMGLAKAFTSGINKALELGADIIVNTDADNQYCADDIEKLVTPIIAGQADIVIGARPVSKIKHFSILKKLLQKLGSWVMRMVSSTKIEDAPSGFRAFSKDAALQLNVFDKYSYTMETIIQARAKGLRLLSVPINVNPDIRKSKLVRNIFDYVRRSAFTMVRMFAIYRPFRFFAIIAGLFIFLGLLLGGRFLYYFMTGTGTGHIQSLILTAILLIVGFQVGLLAVIAELLSINRKLCEDIQKRIKRIELDKKSIL